jgi:hypothetical protein
MIINLQKFHSAMYITHVHPLYNSFNTKIRVLQHKNVSNTNCDDFHTLSNRALSHMSKLFTANKLALNLDTKKKNITKFIMTNSPHYPINIEYNDKYRQLPVNIQFLTIIVFLDIIHRPVFI